MNTLTINQSKATRKMRIPFWLVKLTRFEFWPYWILYIPVFVYYLWLSLKARSFTFFTAANPGIYLGGFVGESKTDILLKVAESYLPQSLYFDEMDRPEKVLEVLAHSGIQYPLIIKPDVGERGNGVEKIGNEAALLTYLNQFKGDFIIQEFVDSEIELGILYYRTPNGKQSGITSIVGKEFLSVTGDGFSALHHLINQSNRAQLRKTYLLEKFEAQLNDTLPDGKVLLLEPIGNHCRGTKFVNRNDLITPELIRVFDAIAQNMSGFYIGRYDLKVTSLQDLNSGKNIKIMELNGVTSEPAHIYDPSTTLWQAYQALFLHYSLVYKIARQNNQNGIKYISFATVLKQLKRFYTDNP
jgi:hypothetical protein